MNSARLSMIRRLARAGDTERAWELFTEAGLTAATDQPDTLALMGRLFKDRALKSGAKERSPLLRNARHAYLHAAEIAPATYPLINAATIALLDGDRAEAATVAERVLAMLDSGEHESDTPYWLGATRAEACLLLGRHDDARSALADAVRLAPRAWEDHASTLRHFRLIHEMLGQSDDWLNAYRPPPSLHFSGIIHVAPDQAGSAGIAEAIEALRPGFAFGALAAGADIMVAELLLDQGAELHIALPSTVEAFRRDSVSRFGSEWESRFDAVIESAETIDELETLDAVSQCGVYVSDEMAMGMAIRQAAMLESGATALRIGEGSRAQGRALDAAWQKRGLPIHRVPLGRTEPGAGSTLPVFAREAVIARADSTITRFSDPVAAAQAALAEVGEGSGTIGIAYGAFDPAEGDDALAETALCIARTAHPGHVPVSRSMALALTLEAPELRCENFGTIASAQGDIALSLLAPA